MNKTIAITTMFLLMMSPILASEQVRYNSWFDIVNDLQNTIREYHNIQISRGEQPTSFHFDNWVDIVNTLFYLKNELKTMRYIPRRSSSGGGSSSPVEVVEEEPEEIVEEVKLGGDANGDGLVNGGDLAIYYLNYDPLGNNNNTFEMGDWNEDGKIDGGDLAIYQQNYKVLD